MIKNNIITKYSDFFIVEQKVYNKEGEEVSKKELLSEFNYLNMEQKYLQQFYNFKEKEGKTKEELSELYNRILTHRNTLKQNKVNLLDFDTYEEVVDELDKISLIEKTNKFINRIPNPLRNKIKENIDYIKQFSNMIIGYDFEDYKNNFLKKISKYRNGSPEEFFEYFKTHLRNLKPIKETIERIKQDPDAEIVYFDDEDYLIALIYSVKTSCNLGSSQWCISNNTAKDMWNRYVVRGGYYTKEHKSIGVQYFIWDLRVEPSSIEHKMGVTLYLDDKEPEGFYLDDTAIDDIENKDWFKHLKGWEDLEQYQQIKLVSENLEIEKTVNILETLSDKEKREFIFKYPKLLEYTEDLNVFNTQEIWEMVQKDISITTLEQVAERLTDEQKIKIITLNPSVLNVEFRKKDIYRKLIDRMSSMDRITTVINMHSLFNMFNLTDEEIIETIKRDPTILVSYTSLFNRIDNMVIKKMYLNNKKEWDNKISTISNDNKTKAELLLSHLIKDDERIKKESTSRCYFFIGNYKTINGKKYLIPLKGENIVYIKDVLNPNPMNHSLFQIIEKAENNDNITLFSSWISKDLGETYKITLDVDQLIDGSDKNQTLFFNEIQKDHIIYDEV